MEQLELFRVIADQYKKFEFKLERCLMTASTLESLRAAHSRSDSFMGVPVEIAQIDAIWFSRPSAGGSTAWEIRLVSPTPLSLLERLPNSATDEEHEQKLKEMEAHLMDLISHRKEAIEEIIAENAGAPDDEDDDFDDDDLDDSRPASGTPRKKGNGLGK
ncbi:MAG TPA: hypothetical protein VFC63_01415 [Blastocatellia bacterium]|nr:hypothetical protein [Blastocatellia bacterium]